MLLVGVCSGVEWVYFFKRKSVFFFVFGMEWEHRKKKNMSATVPMEICQRREDKVDMESSGRYVFQTYSSSSFSLISSSWDDSRNVWDLSFFFSE